MLQRPPDSRPYRGRTSGSTISLGGAEPPGHTCGAVKFLLWAVLWGLLDNPLLALVVVIAIYWALDRYTLGILPDPLRIVSRWRRLRSVNRRLQANPHDRKARLDKSDVLLELGWPKPAFDAVRPNIEAGDHDPHTLFVAGRAAFGSGEATIGQRLLEAVREDDPNFAQNRVDLELGRGLLKSGDFVGAREALQRYTNARTSVIEGNVLLARVHEGLGDAEAAAAARQAAWTAYTEAPGFLRRRERLWAWRANPSRPLLYLAAGAAAGTAFVVFVLPNL